MARVYMASKMHHAEKWRALYSHHPEIHVVNAWCFLEPFVDASDANARKFWQDDFDDIARCHAVIVYAEPGENLRGALVEAGIGLGLDKTIIVVGDHPDYGTWQHHPSVHKSSSIEAALELVIQLES